MTFQPLKVSTIPIPFQKLPKIVAIVDPNDVQTKELLEQLAAERYVVEVTDSFDRDVSEDASVGAYIAFVDGERLENARRLAEAVREAGFETPLWAPADRSHRRPRRPDRNRRGRRVHLFGQQTPRSTRSRSSPVSCAMASHAAPFFVD